MIKNEVLLRVDGLKITGRLYLPADANGPFPTVCICHGIPAKKFERGDERGYPRFAERVCREGFATLIFNFRGCGDSEGNIDLAGWQNDLKAATDYLWSVPQIDRPRLMLLGFSAGASVGVCGAAEDKRISCVAACACPADFNFLIHPDNVNQLIAHFRNIGAIRDTNFPASHKDWLEGFFKVSAVNCIQQVSPRPLLLVHGDKDETVPVEHAYRLYGRSLPPKKLEIIPGGIHRLRQDEKAMAMVIRWLKERAGI